MSFPPFILPRLTVIWPHPILSFNKQRYYTVTAILLLWYYITACTVVVSSHGYRHLLTVERGRMNGGKVIISSIYLCNCRIINYFYSSVFCLVLRTQQGMSGSTEAVLNDYLCNNLYISGSNDLPDTQK